MSIPFNCGGQMNKLSVLIGAWADGKGFYPEDEEVNFGEKVALMHSELSEVLEAHRTGNLPSEHVPGITSIAEEFADVIIRVLDTCEHMNIDIERAIELKMIFNEGRPNKHGKAY